MKKDGKKYLIRESELKEIIKEMLLMEVYNPDDYKNMHTAEFLQNNPKVPNAGDALVALGKIATGWIPDAYKNKVANGGAGVLNDFQRWLLGALGASQAGTAGPDFVPGIQQMFYGVDKGPNADAHQVLNVNAAVNWLRNNAHQKSTHWCARYVRTALNAGGLGLPHGMPAGSAKDYLKILPANGWQEIPTNQAGELGDVCVIAPCIDSSGRPHKLGHIAMCIGSGVWASDFIQKTMHGLAGAPPPGAVHVYRYKNRQ